MNTCHPKTVRVVIADDQPLPNDRIKKLAPSNFEIVAIGGEEILSQTLNLRPDFVLINIAAVGQDCFKLIKKIIEERPQTKVVLYQNDATDSSCAAKVSLHGASIIGRRDLMGEIRSGRELTGREHEVLALLAAGYPMKQIASRLGITYRTVTFHKYRMMERLGIQTNAALMKHAFEETSK